MELRRHNNEDASWRSLSPLAEGERKLEGSLGTQKMAICALVELAQPGCVLMRAATSLQVTLDPYRRQRRRESQTTVYETLRMYVCLRMKRTYVSPTFNDSSNGVSRTMEIRDRATRARLDFHFHRFYRRIRIRIAAFAKAGERGGNDGTEGGKKTTPDKLIPSTNSQVVVYNMA